MSRDRENVGVAIVRFELLNDMPIWIRFVQWSTSTYITEVNYDNWIAERWMREELISRPKERPKSEIIGLAAAGRIHFKSSRDGGIPNPRAALTKGACKFSLTLASMCGMSNGRRAAARQIAGSSRPFARQRKTLESNNITRAKTTSGIGEAARVGHTMIHVALEKERKWLVKCLISVE